MSWEDRGGRRYYYRPKKVAGRVVREYVGPGLAGELAERSDLEQRAAREARRAVLLAERDRYAAPIAATARLCVLADALTAGALEGAGYHRHDRGAWRRRRVLA